MGPGRGTSVCPLCGAQTARGHRPFCSARCRLHDLARWLDGSYRVPEHHLAEDADGAVAAHADDATEE